MAGFLIIQRRLTHQTLGVAECSGMGGRIAPEWVAGINRNGWPEWAGIRSYNSETEMHCYITPIDNSACISCWLYRNCYQEFHVSPSIDEHYFGIIPLHTKVSQRLLQQIRPQVERGFENDKNKLYLNRFFINSLKLARIIGHLSDACQVLFLLADMKTNTKSKAKRTMKKLRTQMAFDF
jgi:hypothetical protein